MHTAPYRIRRLATIGDAEIAALSEILIDCVAGGASVSFMHPLPRTKADDFWRKVAGGAGRNERIVLVAEDDDGIVGTVQVVLDQPDNQPHRGDVSKLLVHRRGRRRGIGAALMRAAEEAAAAAGKTLLVLDTASPGEAEHLYARLGWQLVGRIPDYALWPDGGLVATAVFYKRVGDTAHAAAHATATQEA